MVKLVLSMCYQQDQEMMAVILLHLEKVTPLSAHTIIDEPTWALLRSFVVQAVQPTLGMVTTLTQLQALHY